MILGIIIPVRNECEALIEHFDIIDNSLKTLNITRSYILIDDGSTDNTWDKIMLLSQKYDNVSAIRLARHFGKEMAICAGIDNISADRYLVMDSDLQHPPECVSQMLDLMDKENADIVEGVKSKRSKTGYFYGFISTVFYGLLKMATGMSMSNTSDFKLFTHDVAESIRSFLESDLFFRGIIDWVGFKKVKFKFDVKDRLAGSSSFSPLSLIKLSFDAVLSYTSKPLYLTFVCGLLFLVFSIIMGIHSLYNYFTGNAASGFSTVILLILISSSLMLMSLGIIGMYISRIYNEVKRRPRYIVSKKLDR